MAEKTGGTCIDREKYPSSLDGHGEKQVYFLQISGFDAVRCWSR